MTRTLPGADIRGYYAALGITLPPCARDEVSVRCFADPDAHRRGDRNPSMSVNLIHGAFNCHGCGAHGGAYDAATGLGHTRRQAWELLLRYGLAAPDARPAHGARRPRDARLLARRRSSPTASPKLRLDEHALIGWRRALRLDAALRRRLASERGWTRQAIHALELGADEQQRITIPVRDPSQRAVGLLRYRPGPPPARTRCVPTRAPGASCCPTPPSSPPARSCWSKASPT
jgi:hypothetical protein